MQLPVVALARLGGGARHFDEAVVERQVVAYGVLPALRVVLEVGKALLDEVVDLVEGHHADGGALDGHRDQGDVRVGRLDLGKAPLLLRERRRAAQVRRVHVRQLGDQAALDGLLGLRLAYLRLEAILLLLLLVTGVVVAAIRVCVVLWLFAVRCCVATCVDEKSRRRRCRKAVEAAHVVGELKWRRVEKRIVAECDMLLRLLLMLLVELVLVLMLLLLVMILLKRVAAGLVASSCRIKMRLHVEHFFLSSSSSAIETNRVDLCVLFYYACCLLLK